MPKLKRNRTSGRFYVTPRLRGGGIVTLQITDEGADFLHANGYEEGDELGATGWDLIDSGWTYTLGQDPGVGEVDFADGWVRHDAISVLEETAIQPEEPLTIPCNDELTTVPKFLFSPLTSIYYTILHVENSSNYWLQVPLLIKHRGAMELLRQGAVLEQEFTETGLRMIFQRRWGYFDDDRFGE